jgi:hypothetical protein
MGNDSTKRDLFNLLKFLKLQKGIQEVLYWLFKTSFSYKERRFCFDGKIIKVDKILPECLYCFSMVCITDEVIVDF